MLKKIAAAVLAAMLALAMVPALAEETVTHAFGNFTFEIPTDLPYLGATEDDIPLHMFMSGDASKKLFFIAATFRAGYLAEIEAEGYNPDLQVYFELAALYFNNNTETAGILADNSTISPGMADGGNYVWYVLPSGMMFASHRAGDDAFLMLFDCMDENDTATMETDAMIAYMEKILFSVQYNGEVAASAAEAADGQYVVIVAENAFIRSGPGTEYDRVTTALKDEAFPLLGQSGDWYKISVNGQTCYVHSGMAAIQ